MAQTLAHSPYHLVTYPTAMETGLRRCTSTPTLRTLPLSSGNRSAEEQFEVFVTSRAFKDFAGGFFDRLPPDTRDTVCAMGICHYLVVLKSKADGRIVQFDFGPKGGDIHVQTPAMPAKGRWSGFLQRRKAKQAGAQHIQQCPRPIPGSGAIISTGTYYGQPIEYLAAG